MQNKDISEIWIKLWCCLICKFNFQNKGVFWWVVFVITININMGRKDFFFKCACFFIFGIRCLQKGPFIFKYMLSPRQILLLWLFFFLRVVIILALYSGTLLILFCASVTAFTQKATATLPPPRQASMLKKYLPDRTITDKTKGRKKKEHLK